jgi:peptidyl-prolyl cis-trans isomerase A (cyclophilin A)
MKMSMDTPAPPVDVPGTGQLMARIVTSMGSIEAELYEKDVPRTVANFVALATGKVEWDKPGGGKSREPLYNNTIIHRVIPNFMIQMGCPKGDGTGSPGWRFRDEIVPRLRHDGPGILSMANAGPNTNGSQFFVTEGPTPHLNGKHAVFGKVTSGMDVVNKIARVNRGPNDRPVQPITLQRIEIYRA